MNTHSTNTPLNLTRYCLGKGLRRTPDKPALIFLHDQQPPQQWSYRQLDHDITRLASALRALPLPRHSRIVLRLPHAPPMALAFFAAMAAGLVPIPCSPMLNNREIGWLLDNSRAELIIHDRSNSLPRQTHCPIIEWQQLANLSDNEAVLPETFADDPAFLIYTSGSSGTPKGVLHAHRHIIGRQPIQDGWLGISENDRLLHSGELNWTYTLGVGLMDSWIANATALLYAGNKPSALWPRLIRENRVTIFASVPGIYRKWLHQTHDYNVPSLRHGVCAGEALPGTLWHTWRERIHRPLYEALGMSEISTYISSSPDTPDRPNRSGKPQPGRNVAVLPITEGTTSVMNGDIGLLAVHRSDPGLMLGYWQHEETPDYRGDWFISGDLVSIDDDGYITYHGRQDDLLNNQGYRISPLEVERVLEQHPDIAEAALIRLEVKPLVFTLGACLVAETEQHASNEQIMAWLKTRLAPYKCPKQIHWLSSLPRTANGKLKRKALQSMV